jgi:DNA-binding GntR family transcriptional regulator
MSKMLKPIEDGIKTVSGIAQERIREAILRGTLPPGTRIDQTQLATELNTSLIPVREALKALASEGLVQIIPRRGAFVAKSSLTDLENLYEARCLVEGQVAAQAVPRLTDEQLSELKSVLDAMRAAMEADRYEDFLRSNRTFHFTIYSTAGNTYLTEVLSAWWDLAERYRYRYLSSKDRHPIINAEHQDILDACCSRDGERARTVIEEHIRRSLNVLRNLVEQETQKD